MSAAAILKLQASGFSVEQVSALAELVDTQAATKADVEAASHKFDQKIEATGHKLDQKIDGVEHRLELKIGELKSDLEATERRLDQKIDGVEHRLELKIEGLDRKITETNANTLKWVIGAIGFQTLVLVGTIVGAVAALTRFIPAAPILHQ